MACPGGCINGAGQPVTYDFNVIKQRGQSLYEIDKTSDLRTSLDNVAIREAYEKTLGAIGGHTAHDLLHTHYKARKRVRDKGIHLHGIIENPLLSVEVCVGTNCCLHGAHDLLRDLVAYVDKSRLQDSVEVNAAFCFEQCGAGAPQVRINGEIITGCTFDEVKRRVDAVAAR